MRKLGAGLAGGMLAGALVGAVEAVVASLSRAGGTTLPPVGWAVIVYGLVGALGGLGAGVVAMVLRTGAFGLALGGVAAGLGFVVGRFRVIRDVFLEQAPHGLVPTLVQVAALAAVIAIAVAVWRALRGADERRAVLTRPGVVAVLIAVIGVGWTLAARAVSHESTPAAPTAGAAPAGAPNVILIVVDTLRADHLSCYGYDAVKSPHIDALAADGTRYARMFSQASWTRPSIATILTGLYPSSHGAVHKADVLSDRVETLAEELTKGGYYSVGFPNNINVSPAFGFGQGFAEYHYLAPDLFFHADEAAAELTLYSGLRLVRERFFARYVDVNFYYRPAEYVVARVQSWLDGPTAKRKPFFLFLHFMDPHDPYMVHPFNGVGYARVAMPNPSPAMADTLRQTYDGEIAYLDEHVGDLVAELKRRGVYDDALIVFTADHGEEFHEHDGWWHGTTLYDEQIGVPLIVKPPRGGQGRVVDELVTSLDIAPTVLRAGGLAPPATMQGHVLPLDAGAAPARDSVFAEEDFEGNVLQAVRTRTWKFINANPGNPRGLAPEALYDVATDPRETKNVVADQPTEREEMRAALGRGVLVAKEHAGRGAQTDVDAATRQRLEALGYVDNKAPTQTTTTAVPPKKE
jgi:arylsulfatase A-like enzyme